MKRTYLDWASSAPVLPPARAAFACALKAFGNPASPHEEGRAARLVLEEARTTIARLCGAQREHVVFVSGATEANAFAIEGHVRALLDDGRAADDIHLLYHPGAHASVVETMNALARRGVRTQALTLREGEIDLDALAKSVNTSTALLSLEVLMSETGQRHDARRVAAVLKKGNPDALMHVDASQVPLVESIDRTRFSADLVTLDAQKCGGVRGIGCLVRGGRARLSPLIHGGGQEGGHRSGTPAPALAAAFATALAECACTHEEFRTRAERMRTALVYEVRTALPDAAVNEGKRNAPHIVNFSFPGRDSDYLVALLDAKGYAVSAKSACESDSPEGSRAVHALTGDRARAKSTLRISWGPRTQAREIRHFARALIHAVRFLDTHAV